MRTIKSVYLFVVIMIALPDLTKAEGDYTITNELKQELIESAERAVNTFSENLTLVAYSEIGLDEKKQFIKDINRWVEPDKTVFVFNDLTEDGSKEYEINNYLKNVITFYPSGVEINTEIIMTHGVFYGNNPLWCFAKIKARKTISGINNRGNEVNKVIDLDYYISFKTNDVSVSKKPLIYSITKSKDNISKFDPVRIDKNSRLMLSTTEYDILLKEQSKLKSDLKYAEAEVLRLKGDLEAAERKKHEADQALANSQKQLEEEIERRKQIELALRKSEDKAEQAEEQKEEAEIRAKKAEQKAAEAEKITKSERYVLNFGGGVYMHMEPLTKRINYNEESGNPLIPQITAMLGYRFDFNYKKIRNKYRGNIFGVFGRLGFNNEKVMNSNNINQDLNISDGALDHRFNKYYELEAGFLFCENFKLSSGIGFQNKYTYLVSSTGINMNFAPFGLELGISALYGGDFKNIQLRPSASFYFQFNSGNIEYVKENYNDAFTFSCTLDGAYHVMNGDQAKNAFSQQVAGFFGINFNKTIIGGFAEYGYTGKELANKIIFLGEDSRDELYSNFNEYYGFEGGFLFLKQIRLSYGLKHYIYNSLWQTSEKNKKKYQSITIGWHKNIKHFNFKFDIATVADNEFNEMFWQIACGIGLRFGFAQY